MGVHQAQGAQLERVLLLAGLLLHRVALENRKDALYDCRRGLDQNCPFHEPPKVRKGVPFRPPPLPKNRRSLRKILLAGKQGGRAQRKAKKKKNKSCRPLTTSPWSANSLSFTGSWRGPRFGTTPSFFAWSSMAPCCLSVTPPSYYPHILGSQPL